MAWRRNIIESVKAAKTNGVMAAAWRSGEGENKAALVMA
jgi:hypothetical protein